jgi:hypothetical protein
VVRSAPSRIDTAAVELEQTSGVLERICHIGERAMTKRGGASGEAAKLLRQLSELRLEFDAPSALKKLELLRRLRDKEILKPSELISLHDLLCFVRAYPDNAKLLSFVERELQAFGVRVDKYGRETRDEHVLELDNSGIVNTSTTHPYSYELTHQLLEWHPDSLELDWDENEEDLPYRFFNILSLLVEWQENDTLDYDEDLEVLDWLKLARKDQSGGDLKTIVMLLAQSQLPRPVQRYFFEDLEIVVTFNLDGSSASRTRKRVPTGRKYYQRGPLKRRTSDLRGELVKPATPIEVLPRKQGSEYVRAVNEVLAVRNRELFPLTSANPKEVYTVSPGRGLTIAVYGMQPELRLPLETNFGALLVRNGLPVGYGVAATLFDRVEIAVNVFPAFRAGESAFIFEQFCRLFYHHFGSRVFVVRDTQMGHGEDEALYSGAFWFYYKLGFRAVDQSVRKLAEKEHAKIVADSGYRVPVKTMRRLAKTDVYFHSDPNQMDTWKELSVASLGYVITEHFANKYGGDRGRGSKRTAARVARILGLKNLSQWSRDELVALNRMAPLVASIPDLSRWTRAEKMGVADIIRAKGGLRERKFVLLCNKHQEFKAAVEKLARR